MAGSERAICGRVVKLDRKYPLVELPDGTRIRCEHSTELKKHGEERAVIGDEVEVLVPDGHDNGVIARIADRSTSFVRKDPTERALPQVLASNFDRVIILQPINQLNMKRLERELVLAFETGAIVTVVLTKTDLVDEADVDRIVENVRALAGPNVDVLAISMFDAHSIERIRALMPEGSMAILIGRSGIGKSTLVNALLGTEARATSEVRETDGKGRHTTVSREILQVPKVDGKGGGYIVDMPGVRGLGLWDADEGIGAAFSDVEELAEGCRFRDCKHEHEPGCAVREAVERGELSEKRLESYLALHSELASTKTRRRQSKWKNK